MTSKVYKKESALALRLSNKESHRITIESIELALLKLAVRKEFQQITVSEIVKYAGVSRSAFYKNFNSKEEVIRRFLTDMVENITAKMMNKKQDQQTFWITLFKEILPYADDCKLICTIGLKWLAFECFNKLAECTAELTPSISHYHIMFYTGAIVNVVLEWIESGYEQSPEEMGKIIYLLLN